jgi:hypothetical protein
MNRNTEKPSFEDAEFLKLCETNINLSIEKEIFLNDKTTTKTDIKAINRNYIEEPIFFEDYYTKLKSLNLILISIFIFIISTIIISIFTFVMFAIPFIMAFILTNRLTKTTINFIKNINKKI